MTDTLPDPVHPTLVSGEKDPMVGREVGGYRIQSMIGSGGLGMVYRAVQPVIDKPVAIKVLRWEHARDPDQVARLVAEAKLVSSIRHPGIVDVYTIGEVGDGRQFLAMELLEGESLSQVLSARGALPPAEALPMFLEILHALAAAHRAGVVHRDLKPSNVFVVRPSYGKSYLKVLDFGLAKRAPLPGADTPQTRTSMIVGTPVYMAPEQARGEPVGPRSDLYSAGVLLFEMLTGKPPFDAPNVFDVIHQHLHGTVPHASSRKQGLPPDCDEIIFALMRKDPAARPESAEAAVALVEAALARLSTGLRALDSTGVEDTLRSARRHRWLANASLVGPKAWGLAAAVALVGAAGIGWFAARGPEASQQPLIVVPPPPLPPPSVTQPAPPPPLPATPPPAVPVAKDEPAKPPPVRPLSPIVAKPSAPSTGSTQSTPSTNPAPPAAAPGVLKLHVFPFADVYVDGAVRERGVMDFEAALPVGRHALRLVHPNMAELEEAVEIVSGQTLEKRFKLVPRNGP